MDFPAPIRRQIVRDPELGPGGFHVLKTQDVESILKTVKRLPDSMSAHKFAKSEFRFKGTVPIIIAVQWAEESGTRIYSKEWREVVSRKLDDPEWKGLRLDMKGAIALR